jgi:hypothetical protein
MHASLVHRLPWSRLTHAYGSAEDVPAQLEALFGPDDAQAEAAEETLVSSLYHQIDVTDATAAVALVIGAELARAAEARRAQACLKLIWLFASAAQANGVSDEVEAEDALRRIEQGEGLAGPRGSSLNQRAAAQAVWGALRRVVPHVGAQLANADPQVVAEAAICLTAFAHEARAAQSAIRAAAARGHQRGEARAAVLGAWFIACPDFERASLLAALERALVDADEEVQAVAAYGLARIQGCELSDRAFETLADAAVHRAFPLYIKPTSYDALAALLGARGLDFLLAVVRRSEDFATLVEVIGNALRMGAKIPAPPLYSRGKDRDGVRRVDHHGIPLPLRERLSASEVRIWREALRSDLLWTGRTDLFEKVGLPSDRGEFLQLLRRSAASLPN